MIKGLRKIVDGNVFQGIILFVIVFNSVIMGIETIKDLPTGAVSALATINMVCLIIFIVEIIVKLLAYGLDYFKDPWNWFDVIIVGVSMASGLAFMSAFRAVRVLRVLKSLKALRGTKLIGHVRKLQIIIDAIVKSIPSIGWTGVLLLLIYYIFALIGKAMYTLFQVMTLESWSMGISRPVMAEFSYAWAYFVPFVLLSSFVVMNVVVGIVVNAIDEVNAESAAEAAKEAEASSEVSREDLLKEMHALREHLDRLEKTLEKA